MNFHEASNVFPLDEDRIPELAMDIEANGQKVPIEMLDGKVLDGRRRWMACERAKVKPKTINVKTDDPIAYVLSLNLHRRHLTVSQAAMCAQRARAMYDEKAKERQKLSEGRGVKKGVENCPPLNQGKARDQVGEAFGVTGRTVDRAQQVVKHGIRELQKAVDDGRITVSKAAAISSHPKDLQKEVLKAELDKKAKSPKTKPNHTKDDPPEGVSRGVGVQRANEAINCLKRIPKNDRLRKRGFQIVTDWIRHNI